MEHLLGEAALQVRVDVRAACSDRADGEREIRRRRVLQYEPPDAVTVSIDQTPEAIAAAIRAKLRI